MTSSEMASEQNNHTVPKAITWSSNAVAAFNARTAANYSTHLLPHLKPHFRILDVGCSQGSITLDLARLVPDGHVVGIDIDANAIAVARTSAKEQGITNVEFFEGDAQELSQFESESFDVVHAHQVLLHLSKRLQAMQEMRRVAKTGGIVSTRDNVELMRYPEVPAIERHTQIWRQWSLSKGADPRFGSSSQTVAHEAGFEWENIQMSSWGWEWSDKESKERMAKLAKYGLRNDFIASGLATEKEMDDSAIAWESWIQRADARMMGLDGALLCLK